MADAYLSETQAPGQDATANAPDATSADQRTPEEIAGYWLEQIAVSGRKMKTYVARGKAIMRRYRNKRGLTTIGIPMSGKRMNVLWSNVQTLKPILYAQEPKANVSRRNKTKDPIGRTASIVLQNVLQNSIAMEDFNLVLNQVLDDRLLPGMGVCLVEYEPTVANDEIGWQAAKTTYVHWEDWLTNIARIPQERTWFGYRTFHTRKQAATIALNDSKTQENPEGDPEFAKDVQRSIALDHKEDRGAGQGSAGDDTQGKATIWTIWDMDTEQVYHIAPGYPKAPLGTLPPPVSFDGFFPCPRPLTATTTNDTTYPVPDFDQYMDQADEIDLMTQRIGVLTKSLNLRGIYPGDMESIKQLMENASTADMIPIENYAALQERGGLANLIAWFPIEAVAATLVHCYDARERAIQVMYQITGISDIARGATDPSETASAQQLKAQFGGVRVRNSQKDVQRFIRDILCKKSEVICEHFELPMIQQMSGVKLLTNQQKQQIQQAQAITQQRAQQNQQEQQQGLPVTPFPPMPPVPPEIMEAMKEPSWEDVMGVLRNEKTRGFVVDIETDSTIEPDQQAQQAAAVQFMTAVTQYLEACGVILGSPGGQTAAPLLGEMLAWGTRQFKVADTIEQAIDEFVEMAEKAAQMPPPPNPKVIAEQAKAQGTQVKAQAEIGKAQIGVQTEHIKGQAEQTKAVLGIADTVAKHHANMADHIAQAALAQQEAANQPPEGSA